MTRVTIVPIIEKAGLSILQTNNYRPKALASIISKIIELMIAEKYELNLATHPGQFGCKKAAGTEIAIFTLRQISHHYLRKSTPVCICYLDAKKCVR